VAEIAPFAGLRFAEGVAGPLDRAICPPYDVISEHGRDELLARGDHNLVRVEGWRDAPPDPARYRSAAEALMAWRASGALRREPSPALYLYEQGFRLDGAEHRRRGFLCALRLYEEGDGMVLPHERTFPRARADRLELLRASRANTSPIFGLVEDRARAIARAFEETAGRDPDAQAVIAGELHRLWVASDAALIGAVVDALRPERVYIADGHHRYETALTYLRDLRAAGRARALDAPEAFVLAFLCALDDPGLRILATHRVVRGADAALEAAASRSFERGPIDAGALRDQQPGIALARGGAFERLTPRPEVDLSALPETWRTLPVAQAEELLVRPAREAGAEVEYEHDLGRAIDAARDGAVAVLLRAVDPETLRRVADAGERLPQKTTYFHPKVPAGLVVRALD